MTKIVDRVFAPRAALDVLRTLENCVLPPRMIVSNRWVAVDASRR
jgi:hypothetical protein